MRPSARGTAWPAVQNSEADDRSSRRSPSRSAVPRDVDAGYRSAPATGALGESCPVRRGASGRMRCVTQTTWRQRYAERRLLTGKWSSGLVIERPTGRFAVSFRRSGVHPASGCIVFLPFWLFSRWGWSRGPKTWSVTVKTSGTRRWLMNRTVLEEVASSQEAGRQIAATVLSRLHQGDLDHLATS